MNASEDLASGVARVVDKWWEDNQTPILLSKLGGVLPSNLQQELHTERLGLKRYISEYVPSVRVLRMGRHGGGVAPLDKVGDRSDEEITREFEQRINDSNAGRVPTYDRAVWQAFRHPIPSGSRRFIHVREGQPTESRDIASTEDAPVGPDWFEIKPDELVNFDVAPIASREIHETIQKWASDKVDIRLLIRTVSRSKFEPLSQWKENGSRSRLDALLVGLKGFTKDELSRINIPADVLVSLLERSRR